MGDDLVAIGFVAGLEARDVEFSVHDVLQEFKTHRLVWDILSGGERVAWGAKTITEGGYHSLPRQLHAPGLLLVGEGAGLVNVPRLKGIHYAIESGRLAAEAAFRGAAARRGSEPRRRARFLRRVATDDPIWKELYEVRNMRQAFDRGFYVGGALASMMTVTKGKMPNGRFPTHPNDEAALIRTGRAARYPKPDGKYVFDKLSSVFASGNRTRDDQPNHLQVAHRVRRPVAEAWAWMCPAHVYEVGPRPRRRHGHGRGDAVELRPVRGDLREGRPPDAARRRLRARVHADLSYEVGAFAERGEHGLRRTSRRPRGRRRRGPGAGSSSAFATAPGRLQWAADVVTAVNEDAGDAVQRCRVADQLILLEESGVPPVVRDQPCEPEAELGVVVEARVAAMARGERDVCVLPGAPLAGGVVAYAGIRVEQQLGVGVTSGRCRNARGPRRRTVPTPPGRCAPRRA